MSDSRHLTGPRAKVERAKRHFDELYSSVAPSGERSSELFRLDGGKVSASIPVEWSLMIGDCVHNLRSALDHLIWEAVILKGTEEPGRQTCFPIYARSDLLPEDLDGKLDGTSQKVRDVVDELNPCRGGSTSFSAPLCLLHSLDIEDKHRTLAVIWATSAENASLVKVVETTQTQLATGDFGKLGAEDDIELLMSTSDTTPDQYVEASVELEFGEGPAEGKVVVPTLRDLINATNEIVELFGREVF